MRSQGRGKPGPAIALALMITGCASAGLEPPSVPALTGTVSFGGRRVQADISDVARAATVSLIDTATNATLATTLTNAAGQFQLTFGTRFKPGNNTFYLEATKGLSDNLAGHDAARVRTVARYQSGWVTLTNSMPNVGIRMNLSTTALSVLLSLEGTASIPPEGLIGTLTEGIDATLTPATPDTFAFAGTGATNEAFHTLYGLVDQLLTNDHDPVAGIVKQASSYAVAEEVGLGPPPQLVTLVPTVGPVGTLVRLMGADFPPAPGDSTVSFNGTTATVLAASPTELTVRVPAGATTGAVTVRTTAGTTAPVTFTVVATSSADIEGAFSGK